MGFKEPLLGRNFAACFASSAELQHGQTFEALWHRLAHECLTSLPLMRKICSDTRATPYSAKPYQGGRICSILQRDNGIWRLCAAKFHPRGKIKFSHNI